MRLIYIWTEKYRVLENRGFNFSNQYSFSFDAEKKELDVTIHEKNEMEEGTWEFPDISYVVGDNGTGKTTLMNLMMDAMEYTEQTKSVFAFDRNAMICIFVKDNSASPVFNIFHNLRQPICSNKTDFSYEEKDITIKENGFQIRELLKQTQIIYHSNSFEKSRYLHSGFRWWVQDLSFNGLIGRGNTKNGIGSSEDKLAAYCEQELLRQMNLISFLEKHESVRLPFVYPRVLRFEFFTQKEMLSEVYKRCNARPGENWVDAFCRLKNTSSKEITKRYSALIRFFRPDYEHQASPDDLNKLKQREEYALVFCQLMDHILEEFDKRFKGATGEEILMFSMCKGILMSCMASYQDKRIWKEKISILKKRLVELSNQYTAIKQENALDCVEYLKNMIEILWNPHAEQIIKNLYEFFTLATELLKKDELSINAFDYTLRERYIEFYTKYKNLAGNAHFIRYYWEGLSGGEDNLFSFYSRIYDIVSRSEKSVDSWIYLIDEADMTYHPEWQRRYISSLVKFLYTLNAAYGRENDTVQLIVATHSPILLSDSLPGKVVFLNEQEQEREGEKNFFAANIYDIYQQGMFMNISEYGMIGEYAYEKLSKVVGIWNQEETSDDEKKYVKFVTENIGDPVLKKMFEHGNYLAERRRENKKEEQKRKNKKS